MQLSSIFGIFMSFDVTVAKRSLLLTMRATETETSVDRKMQLMLIVLDKLCFP